MNHRPTFQWAEILPGTGQSITQSRNTFCGDFWHTNTVENYFSILKRGITGVYHHVSQQHLKCYLCKFDFRYNERMALGVDDDERFAKAAIGIKDKRLTYRRTRGQQEPAETGAT
jgi:hypothetical protein